MLMPSSGSTTSRSASSMSATLGGVPVVAAPDAETAAS